MTSPQPDAQAAALVAAYQAQTTALRVQIEGYLRRLWRSLGEWRQPQMAGFTKEAVGAVLGAQQHMVSLTSAFLAEERKLAVGASRVPVAVGMDGVTGSSVRGGVDMAEVYERPFHLVWRQLDELPREAGSIEQAIQAGEDRAVDLAQTDVQLAKTNTALKLLSQDDRVVGYRRVLEGAYSCGLCIVAATLRYTKSELLPIHPGCDCSVAPIWGHADPGLTIDAKANVDGKLVSIAQLADVHDRIEQRFGGSDSGARVVPAATDDLGRIVRYQDALIVHQHGELGPVLGVRGRPFLGPHDLAA